MATVEVFTIGGGALLVNTFNAVAAWTDSGGYKSLLQVAMVMGFGLASLMIAFDGNWRAWIRWFLVATLIYTGLMLPKVDVIITDRLESTLPSAHVGNVPLGLGVLASFSSQIGDYLTTGAELVFGLPSDLNYSKNGMIYGARLLEATQQLRINDPEFATNLDEHYKMCVFYDIMLGLKSMKQLADADDLWATIGPGSPARAQKFLTRHASGEVTSQILTCQAAYQQLTVGFNTMIDQLNGPFSRNLYPKQVEALAKAKLVADLPVAYEYLTGVSKSALEVMKQTLAINAMTQAMHTMAAPGGSSVDVYAATRAEIQTRSSYSAISQSAMKWVPLLHVVLTILFYALFPIIFPVFLFPGGGVSALRGYAYGFFYLAAWGPLYVILHMIMMFKGSIDGAGVTNGNGLTLATWTGTAGVLDDMGLLAGFLVSSIPFLAGGMAKGAMAISGQATSFLAPSQAAATESAREASTGNVSLGNMTVDAYSFNQRQGNLWSHAGSYMGGRSQMSERQDDGTVASFYPGSTVVDGSGAISRLPMTPQLSSEFSSSMMTSASESRSRSSMLANSASESMQTGVQQMSEFRKSVSTGNTLESSFGADDRSVISETYGKVDQAADALHNRFGFSRQQSESMATEFMLSGRLATGGGGATGGAGSGGGKGGTGSGLLGGLFGGGITSGGSTSSTEGGSIGADNSLSAAKDYLEQVSRQQNWADQRDAFMRSSASSSEVDVRANAEALSSSLTNSNSLSREAREAYEASQRFEEAASLRDSNGISVGENLTQDFVNFVLHEQRRMPGVVPDWNPTRGMPQTADQKKEAGWYMEQFIEQRREQIETGISPALAEPTVAGVIGPSVNSQAGIDRAAAAGRASIPSDRGETAVPLRSTEHLGLIRAGRDQQVETIGDHPGVGGRLAHRESEADRVGNSITNNPKDTLDGLRSQADISDGNFIQRGVAEAKEALRDDSRSK